MTTQPQLTTQSIGETAIVIGGSMAGLLAARVLADHFRQVTILERDACTPETYIRKGVPQAQHAHVLMERGRQIVEEFFPGLTQHLLDRGATRGYGRFFAGGGYFCRVERGPGVLFVSRPLLEVTVRERVLALPNVRLRDRYHVLDLATDASGEHISGVQVRQAENAVEVMTADLVVDAGGRGSRMPAWLKALGYPAPEVALVEVGMGYTTRLYRREPHHLDGDLLVNIAPTLENKRACGMLAQEGERWIVTLAGYFGAHPPADETGYLDFARSLPVPDVYEVIRHATPLSNFVTYKFPSNQRRRYERLARFPTGLLVIGDAMCSFTPIYGQGMTVAALEALALRECLTLGTERLAERFFRQASKVVDVAWDVAAGNDARLDPNRPAPPLGRRLLSGYIDRVQRAAHRDREVAWAFLQVASFLAPPPSLMHPAIVWRVARAMLRRTPEVDSYRVEQETSQA